MNEKKCKELRRIAKRICEIKNVNEEGYIKHKVTNTLRLNPASGRAVYQKLKEARKRLDDKQFKSFVEALNA